MSEPRPHLAPHLALPPDLRPADGRFGSGPSKVRPEAVAALAAAAPTYLGTSHRQAAVKGVVGRVRRGLAELFALPDGYEVVLGNGGAACFWEVASFWCIERRSLHLAFGQFSRSFARVAERAPHVEDPVVVEAEAGTRPDLAAEAGVDLYALTHNETSTGVVAPVTRPPGADEGALVAVDATSAAGGVLVDAADFDVYYFAPQKCFGSDGGLWVALCSPAALARAERLAAGGRWSPAFLSLPLAVESSRKDQTYNTPALATLYLMADQLDWMADRGGLAGMAQRSAAASGHVYAWADAADYARPFVADPAQRSPVVATVDLAEGVDGTALTRALRANGILDVEPYRGLARNQLRVATFPAVEPDDALTLTRAIDWLVERLTG